MSSNGLIHVDPKMKLFVILLLDPPPSPQNREKSVPSVANPDPNTDVDPIRIRIHMFWASLIRIQVH
jgi:hypothetical protein